MIVDQSSKELLFLAHDKTYIARGLAIIMRGLPGSGKSYWVDEFIALQPVDVGDRVLSSGYFSTDTYFYRDDQYQFDARLLSEYHHRNLASFTQALSDLEPIVICDNTNFARWESMPYDVVARSLDYQVRYVLVGDPESREHQELCAKRNRHGVPLEQIVRMAKQFEEF